MKILIKNYSQRSGKFKSGDIVDALLDPHGNRAILIDPSGCFVYLSNDEYEVVDEKLSAKEQPTNATGLFSQELKRIEIEFK